MCIKYVSFLEMAAANMLRKPIILFKLRIKNYCFQPRLADTLIVLLCAPILIGLGYWQLERAEQKKQILADYLTLQKTQPISLEMALAHPKPNYFPIEIKGNFDNSKVYFLDNKTYHHQVGYEVIMPFIPQQEGQPVILVNRGWVARGRQRTNLPAIKPVSKTVTLQGIVYFPSKPFLLSDKTEFYPGWPRVIQAIQLKKLQAAFSQPLAPFIIRLKKESPYSYPSEWTPAVTQPSKHMGYAIQWFSFSLMLLFIYIYINTVKIAVNNQSKDTRS